MAARETVKNKRSGVHGGIKSKFWDNTNVISEKVDSRSEGS